MLNFKNPIFHPGLNVTVRAGTEYLNHPAIKPGAVVTLNGPDRGLQYGQALIVALEHFESVSAIPPDLLRFEHMPSCRNDPEELHRQLTTHYGRDYGPGVTLIFFYYPYA